MKSETPLLIWKRVLIFGFILIGVILVLDRAALKSKVQEKKSEIILKAIEGNKVLSDELNVLLRRVHDDLNFFESVLLDLKTLSPNSMKYQTELKSIIRFLDTHSGYFKVRLTNSKGREIFKILESVDHSEFVHSNLLFDLSRQSFYQDLNTVKKHNVFYSTMEANIINGVVELPIRPTVRVSKRIEFKSGDNGLMIANLDGEKILNLFDDDRHSNGLATEKALLDSTGHYIASFPRIDSEVYTREKKGAYKIFNALKRTKEAQGSISVGEEMIVYTRIPLPNSKENWILITRIPNEKWKQIVHQARLTWIFWGLLGYIILIFLLWRHEKKNYQDEVVKVLLKERNEFIQNVSHQLKTPLAIIVNSLNRTEFTQFDWGEIRKEMHHLVKVVDDMLLLALVDATPDIPLKNESILEVLVDSIEMIGAKAKEKGVIIRLNIDEKLHESQDSLERPVLGDLLKSAIMNLIDNAIDFSPEGESVDIFVSNLGPRLIIEIKDNGPGIDDDLVPRLFDRFSRGKSSRKGSGLGLSITKKIIELHKGDVRLLEHKHGTTFEIVL